METLLVAIYTLVFFSLGSPYFFSLHLLSECQVSVVITFHELIQVDFVIILIIKCRPLSVSQIKLVSLLSIFIELSVIEESFSNDIFIAL